MVGLRKLMYIQLKMKPRIAHRIARDCLGMRVRYVHRVVSRIYDAALRPHDIKLAQLNLLVGISLAGPVRPGDLAAWFEMDKSTMSRNTQRMIEHGWVRVLEGEDARSQPLVATRAGERLLEAIRPAWEQAQADAAQALGKALVADLDALAIELPAG